MIKSKKNISGFTLIEILVVVAIIGLLITLAATFFLRQMLKGNDARRKADLNKIKIAVEEYEKDHDCYPDPLYMQLCGSDSSIAIHPYLSNVPCDPVTKKSYFYEADSNRSCPRWFRLYAVLQDKNDSQIIPNIGPGNEYNFHMSSGNAPIPISDGNFSPLPSASVGPVTGVYYGCIQQRCVQLEIDETGAPVCQPAFFNDPTCGTPGNCEGGEYMNCI